jgi:hypothetical protein
MGAGLVRPLQNPYAANVRQTDCARHWGRAPGSDRRYAVLLTLAIEATCVVRQELAGPCPRRVERADPCGWNQSEVPMWIAASMTSASVGE